MNRIFPEPQETRRNDSGASAVTAEESSSGFTGAAALSAPETLSRNEREENERNAAPTHGGDNSITSQAPSPSSRPSRDTYTKADLDEAHAKAALCEQFLELRQRYSGNQASRALNKPHSWFSQVLPLYQAGGWEALLPKRRNSGAKATIELPGWFIPAAKFFYLLTNRDWRSGSAPEAIRRTISLPHLPIGWTNAIKHRFLNALGLTEIPTCPDELRDLVSARARAGKTLLPQRLMKQISASESAVRQFRNPTDASLDYLNAPGTMMWTTDERGERVFIRAGDIFEADDATINFPVCVPWTIGGDPCSDNFGVKVGRFQWLVAIDAASRLVTGFSYTVRPRASYRGEDVLSLMRGVARAHGVPRAWRLEQGVWKSNLVNEAVRQMGAKQITVYSPHQKPFIEGLFNTLWTKLSVQFPTAQVGRFRGENEEANALLTACQRGQKDPRKYFPMLADALEAFRAVIAEKNRTPVQSPQFGRWIPEERWSAQTSEKPLAQLDAATDWIFSPFVREWTVRGMLVGGRIPLFEDLSVPFDFSADWLPQFHGARVKAFFDPSEPRCSATLVLLDNCGQRRAGEVLGTALQVNETAGYARLVMGYGDDPANLGRRARQQAAAAMRREVRGILPNGKTAANASEIRDGLGAIAKLETSAPTSTSAAPLPSPARETMPEINREELAARRRALEEFEQANAHLFA